MIDFCIEMNQDELRWNYPTDVGVHVTIRQTYHQGRDTTRQSIVNAMGLYTWEKLKKWGAIGFCYVHIMKSWWDLFT